MRTTKRRVPRLPLAACAALTAAFGALTAGCSPTNSMEGGPDIAYLTTPVHSPDLPNKVSSNLLPLAAGDQWEMRSICDGKQSEDTLTVVGPATPPGGVPSIEVDALREGQPWRKEYYSTEGQTGVFITAMKDETSPLMVFTSPAPLFRYPFQEGDEWNWTGNVKIGDKGTYPATVVSRLSGYDTTTTPAGRFKICRVDTIVTLITGGRDIRFPSVRWFAPGVGFVRRSFADKGRPAISELTRFNVH